MSEDKSYLDFGEAVAAATLCSCAATNKLLLQKGIITSDEYVAALDVFADKLLKSVYSDYDISGFSAALALLKGFPYE